MNVRPHVAQSLTRCCGRSAIDGRSTRYPGYAAGQRVRRRIKEGLRLDEGGGRARQPKLRGVDRVGWAFTFAAAPTTSCACPSSSRDHPYRRPRLRPDRPPTYRPIRSVAGGRSPPPQSCDDRLEDRRRGEITVGALTASLRLEYHQSNVLFRWRGFDDRPRSRERVPPRLKRRHHRDRVTYHDGGDVILKAIRKHASSTAS